ncbi:MAG: hypothetical protein ACK5LO_12230 [Leucobacter sp.]
MTDPAAVPTPTGASDTVETFPWHPGRMVAVWVVAAVIGVLVTLLVPAEHRAAWLVFAIGVTTLITFGLQIGTAQREGFITRVSYSVGGAVIVIAVIEVISLLTRSG